MLSDARRAAVAGAFSFGAAPPPLRLAVSWLLRCGADFRALLSVLRGALAPEALIAFEARCSAMLLCHDAFDADS
jgi:hypothetical protein